MRGCLPGGLLKLVPLEQIEFTPGMLDHIRSNEALYRVELDDVAAGELGLITGSAMIKDETRCIRCGLCAARCPVDVITMEAYHVVSEGLPPLVHIQTAPVVAAV